MEATSFKVPTSGDNDTLTCLTVLNKNSQQHNNSNNKGAEVVDVAICWNYLVVGDTSGITKYGLVNNKPCLERYEASQQQTLGQILSNVCAGLTTPPAVGASYRPRPPPATSSQSPRRASAGLMRRARSVAMNWNIRVNIGKIWIQSLINRSKHFRTWYRERFRGWAAEKVVLFRF